MSRRKAKRSWLNESTKKSAALNIDYKKYIAKEAEILIPFHI